MADARTTRAGTAVTLDVTENDSDADGDPLTVTVVTGPASGTVTCSTAGLCTYTPTGASTGTDRFTYRVADGQGGSATAVVTITVLPPNGAPQAVDDTTSTGAGRSVEVNVLANDSDPDGDLLFVGVERPPTRGTVDCTPAGTCTYTPTAGLTGADSFTYRVSDGQGGTAVATVRVTVTAGPVANRPPVAGDDAATTTVGTSIAVEVLADDVDPDGDRLALGLATVPVAGGTAGCAGSTCTYQPAAGFVGTDRFTYRITDPAGLSATATVTVVVAAPAPTNRAPLAGADSATTGAGSPVVVDLLANDSDPDNDPLTTRVTTVPGNGSVTCVGDRCTYTPNAAFTGTDSFDYQLSDGRGGLATATVTLTVTPAVQPNRAPVAVNDTATTTVDTAVTVRVVANDSDGDGDLLTATVLTQPANGTATCTGATCTYTPRLGYAGPDAFAYTVSDGRTGSDTARVDLLVVAPNTPPRAQDDAVTTSAGQSVAVPVLANDSDPDGDPLSAALLAGPANGTVVCTGGVCTYTPGVGFTGTDTFTYTVSDGRQGTAVGRVTVTVAAGPAVDRAPVARPDSATTTVGTPVVVMVLANDSDPDNDPLTATVVAGPQRGSATCTGGTCTYTPSGTAPGTDSFTYAVSDGRLSTTSTVTVVVQAPNGPPVAADDRATTTVDTAVGIAVLVNDSDPDGDALTVAVVRAPTSGTVSCVGGTCTYTPSRGFTGDDSFTYSVSDGRASDVGLVTVVVAGAPPVNTPPVYSGPASVSGGTVGSPATVQLVGTDAQTGTAGLVFSTVSALPPGLSLSPSGVLSGTPTAAGSFPLSLVLTDPQGLSSTSPVTVVVTGAPPVNTPPVYSGPASVSGGTVGSPATVQLVGTDAQTGTAGLVFSTVSRAAAGAVAVALGCAVGHADGGGELPAVAGADRPAGPVVHLARSRSWWRCSAGEHAASPDQPARPHGPRAGSRCRR